SCGRDRARWLGCDGGREVRCCGGFEGLVCALAIAAGVGGDDPEVVGGVGGEGAQRRGHRDGAHPRPRRGRARRAFAVGGGGAVFELAFGHFAAVGVDHRVDRRARGGGWAGRGGGGGGGGGGVLGGC